MTTATPARAPAGPTTTRPTTTRPTTTRPTTAGRTATGRTAARLSATVLAVALLLGGCASPAAYSEETAQDLQQRVLAVTDAAASSDFSAAQMRIDELRVAANDALARGDVSDERFAAITSALDLVETDVTAALAAEAAAAEAARVAEEQRLADEAAAAAEAARLAEEKAKEQQDNEDKRGKDNDKDDD